MKKPEITVRVSCGAVSLQGLPVPSDHCIWVQLLTYLPLVDDLGISIKPPETSRQIQVTTAKGSGELGLDPLLDVSKGLKLLSESSTRSRWEDWSTPTR